MYGSILWKSSMNFTTAVKPTGQYLIITLPIISGFWNILIILQNIVTRIFCYRSLWKKRKERGPFTPILVYMYESNCILMVVIISHTLQTLPWYFFKKLLFKQQTKLKQYNKFLCFILKTFHLYISSYVIEFSAISA